MNHLSITTRDSASIWTQVTPTVRRRLLTSALEAFADLGYHDTKTRDISARAKVSAGGLYVHYDSKEEILFEICQIGHRETLALAQHAVDAGTAPMDRVELFVDSFTTWHAHHLETARIISRELGALTPEHLHLVVDLRRQTQTLLQTAIEEGVRDGQFHVSDTGAATVAILSMCLDVSRWFRPGGQTPDELGTVYASFAISLLGASTSR